MINTITAIKAAAISLSADLHDPSLHSLCPGRRNYRIITWDKTYTAGLFGRFSRHSYFLSEIAEHNIHFYYFTYKKDFEAVCKALDNMGYRGILI